MPSLPPSESKVALRQHWRRRRRDISPDQRTAASRRICERILASAAYRNAAHIAAYWPLPDEVDITPVLSEAFAAGKQTWLPRVGGEQMAFARYDPAAVLERAAVGTLQPGKQAPARCAERLELVLLPLLAFTRSGWRLGMGGGYYDRAFSFMLQARLRCAPTLVGVALSEQEAPVLPRDPWDVPMKHVATEQEWIDCG